MKITSVSLQALRIATNCDEISFLQTRTNFLGDRFKHLEEDNKTLPGELNNIQAKPLPNSTLQEIQMMIKRFPLANLKVFQNSLHVQLTIVHLLNDINANTVKQRSPECMVTSLDGSFAVLSS